MAPWLKLSDERDFAGRALHPSNGASDANVGTYLQIKLDDT